MSSTKQATDTRNPGRAAREQAIARDWTIGRAIAESFFPKQAAPASEAGTR
jgi:hypothetical protein